MLRKIGREKKVAFTMEEKTISMAEKTYKVLKTFIQNCDYMPGQPISEKGLCEALGCGRTPVREALLALRDKGLVEIFPRKGIRVAGFTREQISEIYQIRKLVEPTVCVQYCLRFDKAVLLDYDRKFQMVDRSDDRAYYQLDTEFHRWLVAAAENRTLEQIVAQYEANAAQMLYGIDLLRAALGSGVTDPDYVRALEKRQTVRAALMESLRDVDACLMTGPTNAMHFCGLPSVALRLGMDASGAPCGMILYGADEKRLFSAALCIEQYAGPISWPQGIE